MMSPRAGPEVCETCFNLTDGYPRCYACSRGEIWLDAVAPISYSVAHEQLHHVLASYKRLSGGPARRLSAELAAVLWRHLSVHEACVARAAGVTRFELVSTVPSGARRPDRHHPLGHIVGDVVQPTRDRYERLLERSSAEVPPRKFARDKFRARRAAERRAGAADRRHVDHGRERAERRRRAEDGRGRRGGRGGDRTASEPVSGARTTGACVA